MKTAAILGFSSLLVGLVAAVPLEKRAYVIHTVTEEVVETVDVTVTITVEPVTTTHAAAAAAHQAAETTEAAYSWSWDHNQHQAEAAQETHAPVATTTHQEEEAYVAATEAPASTTTTSAAAAVQEEPEQEEEQTQEQPQEQYQEPAKEEVKEEIKEEVKHEVKHEEATQQQQPSSQQSYGGESYTGDITFYQVGLGACGWVNDGSSEYVVALSHELMGTQSNGNPYCGRTIEVSRGGKTVKAKVVDKCMDCPHNNVDLSPIAFNVLAHPDEGRVPGCSWHFVD